MLTNQLNLRVNVAWPEPQIEGVYAVAHSSAMQSVILFQERPVSVCGPRCIKNISLDMDMWSQGGEFKAAAFTEYLAAVGN